MKSPNEIEQLVKNTHVRTGENTDGRIFADAKAAFMASTKDAGTNLRTSLTFWGTIMKRKITQLAAAAVVVIGVVGVFAWLTGGNGGASVVFADVLQQVREAQSVTFRMTASSKDDTNYIIDYMFMEPGHMRFTLNDGLIWIADFSEGKTLVLDPAKKTGMAIAGMKNGGHLSRKIFNVLDKLKTLHAGSEESLGTNEIDGRSAVGFLVRKEGKDMTIWVDPETDLPIRIEAQEEGRDGVSYRLLLS